MSIEEAREDLAHIRRLMEETRRAAYLSGGYFIVWGAATGLGLIATWMHITGLWGVPIFGAWTACTIIGLAGTFVLVRQERRRPVDTPAGKFIGTVWLSLGITMLIIFFAGIGIGALDGATMPALASSLAGTGIFLTGTLAGLTWLRNTAFGWWAGAATMFAWPGVYVLWLMGLMLLVFYIIPGIILIKQRYRTPQPSHV